MTARRLTSAAMEPFPLGQLTPRGWLRRQLRLQADGMAGHLDEFWPDVADSAWIGGSAEGWERAPYWLDGLVPLAAVLDDDRLKAKAARWVHYLVEHQEPDGWMGPDNPAGQFGPYDVWPRMVLLKVLLQFHSYDADDRIVPAAMRLCRRIDEILRQWPLYEWGRVRWADLVLSLAALHDLTGADWLLEMADRVSRQGYDWASFAQRLPYRDKVDDNVLQAFKSAADGRWMNDRHLASHGVNVAMGLRALPIWSRHSDTPLREPFRSMLAQLDEFHGQPTGLFSADEHLAGSSPAQGTETCAVVEFLYSLGIALETWGPDEPVIGRWERIAFNALPASARANECGHQYDQQANQVICHVTEDRPYTNNGPDANIFGLAPHFGCCTANRHQGWPKFAARLWMRPAEGGLAALSYSPCRLDTTVDGRRVRVEVSGDYPFADLVEIAVTADGPAEFPIRLRIPEWAAGATIAVDARPAEPVAAGCVHVLRQDWSGQHHIALSLPASVTAQARPSGAMTLTRGPLVFALAVAEEWRQIGGAEPYGDWEVHPAAPWNYRLELDPADPGRTLQVATGPADRAVFSTDGAPIRLHGKARLIPEWTLRHGAADLPPRSPQPAEGPDHDVMLLPYGAARLRVTELPWYQPVV